MRPIDRVNLRSSQESTDQAQPQLTLVPTAHSPNTPPVRKPRFYLYTPEEIRSFPEPSWLIADVIVDGSFTLLFGPSGVGKSFVALDMAFCIATGRPWHGRQVEMGPVVYVFGEGKAGLSKRLNAWEKTYGKVGSGFYAIDVAAQLPNPKDLRELFDSIRQAGLNPRLCVFDTLARCSAGKDENSSKDMGEVVEGVTRTMTELNVNVLLIHHTGRKRENPRGSSALDGAADTMLFCDGTGPATLTLRCAKQKDAEPFKEIGLRREKAGNSCIVTAADIPAAKASRAQTALEALQRLAGRADHKAWHAEWHKATGQVAGTFSKAKKDLLTDGRVVAQGKFFVLSTPVAEMLPETGTQTFLSIHPLSRGGGENGEKGNEGLN